MNDDRQLEVRLATLLRLGVFAAAAVVVAGGISYLIRHGGEVPQYSQFHSEPADLRELPGIFSSALHLHSRGIIQFGVLMLIAVPILRVAFSLLAFWRERDWLYTGITAVVLALLVLSLTLS